MGGSKGAGGGAGCELKGREEGGGSGATGESTIAGFLGGAVIGPIG